MGLFDQNNDDSSSSSSENYICPTPSVRDPGTSTRDYLFTNRADFNRPISYHGQPKHPSAYDNHLRSMHGICMPSLLLSNLPPCHTLLSPQRTTTVSFPSPPLLFILTHLQRHPNNLHDPCLRHPIFHISSLVQRRRIPQTN